MTNRCLPQIVFAAALAGLALTAPAQAGGPLDAAGRLAPDRPEWMAAIPGQNPLDAEQAAAALAFTAVQADRCADRLILTRVDFPGLVRDIEAGGNRLEDFHQGGRHHARTLSLIEEFTAMDDVAFAPLCTLNPYHPPR